MRPPKKPSNPALGHRTPVATPSVSPEPAPAPQPADSIASDILRGAESIAAYIGRDIRSFYYLAERGCLPVSREGTTYVTTKSRLRRFYNGDDTTALGGDDAAQ